MRMPERPSLGRDTDESEPIRGLYLLSWGTKGVSLDDIDHQPYIERTITLATEAAERGDRPCGSLLVRDGDVLAQETNRVHTGDDIALHPELSLARWVSRELPAATRRESVVYTTVEPCSMCATGLAFADVGGIVFCVSGERYWTLAEASDHDVPEDYIPCAEVFERVGADIQVVASVLEDRGVRTIRDAFSV